MELEYNYNLPTVKKVSSGNCTFLLGTDRHIGEGTLEQETRVGITPSQAARLRKWLENAGISLDFYMVRGAGTSAGFDDEEYSQVAGAIIVDEIDIPKVPPPHVVHALKEPCPYERWIPGPFVRIGALHTGSFSPNSGLAHLFGRPNFSAIFDGSAIGGYGYKFGRAKHAIPIRSSMSVFAGRIAADLILQRAPSEERGKIVIVGGGVVGVSCLRRLLNHNWETIVVLEKSASTCDKLRKEFEQYQGVQFRCADSIDVDSLKGAYGLLLCAFVQGQPAPKVVSVNQLIEMATGGIIVDISIDEGGSISSQEGETPEEIREQIESLGKNLEYIADTHMPRKYPREASEAHGEAVLPYLCVLLYLSARERSSPAAVEYIRRFSSEPSDYFTALVCDLREGLAFTGPSPITLFGVVKNKETIQQFLRNLGVECSVV